VFLLVGLRRAFTPIGRGERSVIVVEIITAVVVAVAGMAAAGFRYMTVRELARRAKPEDIPAIVESIYQKRDLGPMRGQRRRVDRAEITGTGETPDEGT
jgi:hypothetical protein